MKRWQSRISPFLTAVLLLAAWHAAVVWTHTRIFPGPVQVLAGLKDLAGRDLLAGYVRDSLLRVSAGYLAAVALGLPLGLMLGGSPTAAAALNPPIQIMRPISPLAWIPLAIIWFGVGSGAAVFLIFLASVFPIIVATIGAVRSIPPVFRNAGQNFGLPSAMLLRKVIFPAALPQILVGLRIALGIAWLVVVAAEMIAVDSGLGYLIIDSRNAGQRYDLVVAGMLLIGIVGVILDSIMRRIETLKSVRWGFCND